MSKYETITDYFHITEMGFDLRVDKVEAKTQAEAKRKIKKLYPYAKLSMSYTEPCKVMRQTAMNFE